VGLNNRSDRSRRRFLQLGVAALGTSLIPAALSRAAARITSTDLGGATLFQGAGVQRHRDRRAGRRALMIDGGRAANADALIEAVKKATGTTRIHTLINTHWHPDQVGANEAVGKAGGVIFAHEKTKTLPEQHDLQRDRYHRPGGAAASRGAAEPDDP
jgi:glyoxylase-like metal-dependent hydrolase (beta-lactamase superfamily II)